MVDEESSDSDDENDDADPPGANETWVDDVVGVRAFLLHISELGKYRLWEPQVFVDCEGNNLGRSGTLSLLQIYLAPHDRTWIFDVTILGDKVFNTDLKGNTIRSILQDKYIYKCFWDVRNDRYVMHLIFTIPISFPTCLPGHLVSLKQFKLTLFL